MERIKSGVQCAGFMLFCFMFLLKESPIQAPRYIGICQRSVLSALEVGTFLSIVSGVIGIFV